MPIFDDLEHRILQAKKRGEKPIVVFDVDDTIIDCRYRKAQVFKAFAVQAEARAAWPQECEKLLDWPWERMKYRVQENLDLMGIHNEALGKALYAYWLNHYFTYTYLLMDRAFPGAQAFVKKCQSLGADIVYLTARDHAGMYQGTIEALELLDFPLGTPDVHVMLKPEVSIDDHHFKVGALDQIASLGTVVASLENELVNLNAMAERFQDAAMYWRKTLYAPNPPPPHHRIEILERFP